MGPHLGCCVYPPLVGFCQFQMEVVPSTFQKPVSGDLAWNGYHEFVGSGKSYRCMSCSGNARGSQPLPHLGGVPCLSHRPPPRSDLGEIKADTDIPSL